MLESIKVKHFTLDKNNGALYKIWQQYNTTHGMDQETIDYVNRITYPQLKVNEVEVLSFFTYHIKLTTNAIHIIEFKKYI
ncbi:regulatory protein [Staphylococcus gallinarum]|uniref:Regulatory protein n=1 Tax=Staphylococcus gallinarum TaxID=1293 RepID=A0A380FL88_STAGA|nr:regulatory protein [Staphylococcus gallinarum]